MNRTALSPAEAPIPVGTLVVLDEEIAFHDRNLISGGSPWRLLRLAGASRSVIDRWIGDGVVRSGEERFARTLVQQGLLCPRFSNEFTIDDVDIVIPVRDDVASLRMLLSSLQGLHVTIVDDGSRNPLAIVECASLFNATLVRLEENEGPAGARNAGLRSTDRALVWFLDVDISIDNARDVFQRLGAHFADPLVGAVAPRVRGGAGSSLRDHFEQRFSPLDMGPRSSLVLPGGPVSYVPSACVLVRRRSLGCGFDTALRTGEDVDLVWRLHDEGWLVRFCAEVVVTHRARGTWRAWWNQRVGYGLSASELAIRHGSRLAPVRVDTWTLAAWASVLMRRPAVGARILRVARKSVIRRLGNTTEHPRKVATSIVSRGMVYSTGPFARSMVRTYGPLVLVAAIHPKIRRRALAIFALGTAWRWRRSRVYPVDIALAVADDAAYAFGVWRGAWRTKSLRALTPQITKSSVNLREVLGLRSRNDHEAG